VVGVDAEMRGDVRFIKKLEDAERGMPLSAGTECGALNTTLAAGWALILCDSCRVCLALEKQQLVVKKRECEVLRPRHESCPALSIIPGGTFRHPLCRLQRVRTAGSGAGCRCRLRGQYDPGFRPWPRIEVDSECRVRRLLSGLPGLRLGLGMRSEGP
jgi:hypothetical protein